MTTRLAVLDRWTLAYSLFAAAWMLGHASLVPQADVLATGHGALALLALLAPRMRTRGGVLGLLGDFYPLLLTVLLYGAIGHVNRALGISHDGQVQGWEEWLFGGQPSRDWIRASNSPVLSTALHASYLSYYFILAAAPLVPWLLGRRQEAARVVLLIMTTFYLCYAVFLLYPVAGPRYAFPQAQNAATGVPLARLTQGLLDGAAAWGTAFPSSHVAASVVAALAAFRVVPALGAVLVPLAALLTLATVYGQFHYAVDALAGLAVAAMVLALGGRAASGRRTVE